VPLRIELYDDVRALVHAPDVVVLVDADDVREVEAVEVLANFAQELAALIELEQLRVTAAMIDEDVSL
jgi:hypothetical protein